MSLSPTNSAGTVHAAPLPINPAMGPGRYLSRSMREGWAAVRGLFAHPRRLIVPLALAAVWLALGFLQLRWPGSVFVRFLSFATFAQGGYYGGTLGAVGGVVGKAIFVAFVTGVAIPLLARKPVLPAIGNKGRILLTAFRPGGLAGVSTLGLGVGSSWCLYNFLTGDNARQNCLIGAVVFFYCLRALLNPAHFGKGFLLSLLYAARRGRPVAFAAVNRPLAGALAGFMCMTAVSLLLPGGLLPATAGYWLGVPVMAVSAICLLASGGAKKTAAAAALVLWAAFPAPATAGESGAAVGHWELDHIVDNHESLKRSLARDAEDAMSEKNKLGAKYINKVEWSGTRVHHKKHYQYRESIESSLSPWATWTADYSWEPPPKILSPSQTYTLKAEVRRSRAVPLYVKSDWKPIIFFYPYSTDYFEKNPGVSRYPTPALVLIGKRQSYNEARFNDSSTAEVIPADGELAKTVEFTLRCIDVEFEVDVLRRNRREAMVLHYNFDNGLVIQYVYRWKRPPPAKEAAAKAEPVEAMDGLLPNLTPEEFVAQGREVWVPVSGWEGCVVYEARDGTVKFGNRDFLSREESSDGRIYYIENAGHLRPIPRPDGGRDFKWISNPKSLKWKYRDQRQRDGLTALALALLGESKHLDALGTLGVGVVATLAALLGAAVGGMLGGLAGSAAAALAGGPAAGLAGASGAAPGESAPGAGEAPLAEEGPPDTMVVTYPDGSQVLYERDPQTGEWTDPVLNTILDTSRLPDAMREMADQRLWTGEQARILANREDAHSRRLDEFTADAERIDTLRDAFSRLSPEAAPDSLAGQAGERLDALRETLNETGSVDPGRIDQLRDLYGRLLRGDVMDASGLPRDYTLADNLFDAMKSSAAQIARCEDAKSVLLRVGTALATGGMSEVVFAPAQGLTTMSDYVERGGDSALEGFGLATGEFVAEELAGWGIFKGVEKSLPQLGKALNPLADKMGESSLGRKILNAAGDAKEIATADIRDLGRRIAGQNTDDAVRAVNAASHATASADDAGRSVLRQADASPGERIRQGMDAKAQAANNDALRRVHEQRHAAAAGEDGLRRDLFREGREAGAQKVDRLEQAHRDLRAAPDSTAARGRFDQAMWEVQADKHAQHSLNDLAGRDADDLRGAFNERMRQTTAAAEENARLRLAEEYGVVPDDVKVVRATRGMDASGPADAHAFAQRPSEAPSSNPAQPGRYRPNDIRVDSADVRHDRIAYDNDETFRIRQADPATGEARFVDVPRNVSESVYQEEFYKANHGGDLPLTQGADGKPVIDRAAVSEYAQRMDQTVTDRLHAEAYGAGDADLRTMLQDDGLKRLTDPEAVGKTIQYKSDEWMHRADDLRAQAAQTADPRAARDLLIRAEAAAEEGMRQTAKQFEQIVQPQAQAINEHLGREAVRIPDRLQTAIGVMEQVGVDGFSVADAERVLADMGLTPADVANQVGAQMESMQKLGRGVVPGS